jgi:hypothetical protein
MMNQNMQKTGNDKRGGDYRLQIEAKCKKKKKKKKKI